MKSSRTASILLLPFLLALDGCKGTWTTTASGSCTNAPTGQSCTVGGQVSYSTKSINSGAEAHDLQTVTDGSYTISASVPSGSVTPDPNGSGVTTITATTDQGYTSSIVVALTPVAAAISPVNDGDVVYSYNLPASDTLNNWVQQVAANTTSSVSIESSAGLPFVFGTTPGSVTMTSVVTSNAVGTVNAGNVIIQVQSSKQIGGCKPGTVCPE